MYHGIKVVKAKELLASLPVKIKGSNKSKTRLSMLDRIKRFYYEKKTEFLVSRINGLINKKTAKGEEVWNKIESNLDLVDGATTNEKLKEAYDRYEEKIDSKLDKLADEIKIVTGKIKDIDDSVEEEKTEEKVETKIEQPVEQSKEEKPVETKVEEEKTETVMPETNESEVKTSNPEEKENEVVKQIRLALEQYNSEMAMSTKNLVVSIEKVYKEYAKKRIKMSYNQSDAIYNKIIAGKDATISAREEKIASLEKENIALKSDYEMSKTELRKNYDLSYKQQDEINSKDATINELKEQISLLQKTLDSKDNELNSKDGEIKRLKEFEDYYLTQRRAQVMAESLNTMVQEDTSENAKTL